MKQVSKDALNEEQHVAVYSRDCSILVSAPAGSGKTKILVSRILSLLEKDFYHIDQLLVLTFTNAAALEMKQRLQQQLEKRLQEPLSPIVKEHLTLQKQKLTTAYITNFHGFCSTLLKQHGYCIGVSSNFEIVSDPTLIKHQILDTCIASWLEDPTFQTFVHTYFNEYHFQSFKSMLFTFLNLKNTIYDFKQYMEDTKKTIYAPIIESSIDKWKLKDFVIKELMDCAIEGKNKVFELHAFCQRHGLSFFYQNPYTDKKRMALKTPFDAYFGYYQKIIEILKTGDLDTITHTTIDIEKPYTIAWDDETRVFQKEYNSKKTTLTKHFSSTFESLIYPNNEEFKVIMETSLVAIESMYCYMQEFDEAYTSYKKKHNLLDFNDLEQYTLTLLEPNLPVVDSLYHQLKEIMIDEYQDTNQIQETLLMKIANYQEPSIPCFMVGDMKQSIYRFREADPQIFNEKYETFATENSSLQRRIDLKFNYRSNKIVLDSINYIFNQIMDKEIGGLEYYHDESAKLNYDYLRKENCHTEDQKQAVIARIASQKQFATEILVTNKSTSTTSSSEYEAILVAKRISELVNHLTLQNGKVATYKDVVVLMRNATEFITFKKIFDRFSIPTNIVLSQGFLSAVEIIDSIYVLKAIDNHLDDIAFTSLLTGNYAISHFDEEFLMMIKDDTSHSIYQQLMEYLQRTNDIRVQAFMDYYHYLVTYSKTHTVKETMTLFYQDSQYPLFVSSLVNGKQRIANIELFLEKLTNYKQLPLHSVVEQFSQQLDFSINMSPSPVVSNNDNVVSFMTIHKSKGLEFPIVFVSQMHRQFNKQDARSRLISDKNFGISLKPRVVKKGKEYPQETIEYENKYRNLLAHMQTKEMINEEMRILYVALTRASEKLICTGVIESPEVFIKWQEALLNNEEEMMHTSKDTTLLYRNIRKSNSYLDWVGLSIVRHPSFIKKCKEKDWQHAFEDTLIDTLKQNSDTLAIYQNANNGLDNTMHAVFDVRYIDTNTIDTYSIESMRADTIIDESTRKLFSQYKYPYATDIPKTIAVTKKIHDGDRFFQRVDYEEEITPVVQANIRGTIIHSVLEHLPVDKNITIDNELQRLYQSGLYDSKEIAVIQEYQSHIIDFINSDVYLLMTNSVVYKEKSFSFMDDTKQIIHGIFDVVCIQDGLVTIIDYKTDRIKKDTSKEELIALHKEQMEYYKQVLTNVFPTYQIQAIVYYLHINQYVTL